MTASLKPYPAYKDSGVEWLGEVPEHWEVKRLKYLTRFRNGIAFKPADWKDAGVPIIRIENLNGSDAFNYTDRDDLPAALLIQPGEIVFAWSGNRGTSFGSFEWDRDFPAYLNQHIFKLTDYKLHRKYFLYLLRTVTKNVEDNAHGIIGLVHITKPALGAIFVPVAPSGEQTAITHCLDYADRRIQRYVQVKQKLITLLEEQKQAIVHQAVTGQIDVRTGQPYPAYKDSGVEWLGEVPEHWETLPLKFRATCSSGDQIAADDIVSEPPPEQPNRVPVIGGNGRMGYSRVSNILSPVLAVGRVGALCGNVHIVSPPAWITDNALVLRVDQTTYELRYLADALRVRNLNELANQSAQPLVTGTQIRNQRLPLPPLGEQTFIVNHLDQATTDIDHAISRTQRQIDLLSEYRTRLISDVVTGKLDVREAAARLPEVDPLETEADLETLEPTAELTEEFEAIAEGVEA